MKQNLKLNTCLLICSFSLSCFNSLGQKVISKNYANPLMETAHQKLTTNIEHIRFGSISDPINGLTVTWKSEGIEDMIRWGYTKSYEKGTFFGAKRNGYEDYFYDFNFPPIEADATIYYRIFDSSNKKWTDEKTYLSSSSNTGSKFSFLAIGDSRTNVTDWEKVSNAANNKKTDFTLFTGDIINDGSVAEDWNAWFDHGKEFLEKNLVYHSVGNHECRGNGETVYPNVFTLPKNTSNTEYYYSFTFGNAIFICLNTEEDETGTFPSTQYLWLLNVLEESKDKTWKFVWFHRPFYTTGSHEGEMNYKMNTWFDAFDTFGVDMIFNGHDHMYERTKPIQKNSIVVAEYGSNSDQGRCQIVCGGAGAPLYSPGSASWLAKGAKKFHYCKIDIDGYDLSFKAYDENNVQFDALKLHKSNTVAAHEQYLVETSGVFPNPANSHITIKGDKLEISEIKIYNLLGQDYSALIRYTSNEKNMITIDLSGLSPGFYFLKTQTATYKIYKK